MHPVLLVLSLLLVLTHFPVAAAPGDVRVINGDFEQPAGPGASPVPGWTFYRWEGVATPSLDRAARTSGGAAAHLHGPDPGKAAIHQRLHLVPGRYRLSALTASRDLRPGKDNLTARLHLDWAAAARRS